MGNLDLLIIGSGISGLSAAIEATKDGAKVLVVTKSIPTKNNSVMAQGGINAALGNLEKDSINLHINDTLKAAHSIANENMVKKLCQMAPDAIRFLEELGVPFSRIDGATTPLESIAQRKLGGASAKRACYAQDYTGLKILHTLLDYALGIGVEIRDNLSLLELSKNSNGKVCGAQFFNFNSGKVESIYAKRVILATGGFGSIYSKNTNSIGSSGDGVATTLRAGGVVSNLEFVQFHPTTLKGSNILVSESARGEGGLLVDSKEERFVDELAPRDVVAKAIFDKIKSGDRVFLDLRNIKNIEELMPQELKLIKRYAKVDATKELVEIEPAVHYSIGGISVDESLSVKRLDSLFAIGECSDAKVHGANRLGGNSLLEAVAFGRLGAKEALGINGSIIEKSKEVELMLDDSSDNFKIYKAKEDIATTLFRNVGIIRDENGLKSAKKDISNIDINLKVSGKAQYNSNLLELIELKNSYLLAKALIHSALWRKESRGAHFRADYPNQKDEFAISSKVSMEDL